MFRLNPAGYQGYHPDIKTFGTVDIIGCYVLAPGTIYVT